MIIINEGRVNYSYRKCENEPEVYETVCSNRVESLVINCNLKVEKYVNKDIAGLFEILCYKIIIRNISENLVKNIYLYDELPKNAGFLRESLIVRGAYKYFGTPKKLYLGNLKAGKNIVIYFKVIILKCCHSNFQEIVNSAKVTYDYIYNIEKEPAKLRICSNKVKTLLKCNIFKEVSRVSSIFFENKFCGKIYDVDIDINLKKNKVITCIDGYKLLIIFEINYCVFYFNYGKLCSTYRKEYFSEIININEKAACVKDFDIDIIEENCSYSLSDNMRQMNIYNIILIIIKGIKV